MHPVRLPDIQYVRKRKNLTEEMQLFFAENVTVDKENERDVTIIPEMSN